MKTAQKVIAAFERKFGWFFTNGRKQTEINNRKLALEERMSRLGNPGKGQLIVTSALPWSGDPQVTIYKSGKDANWHAIFLMVLDSYPELYDSMYLACLDHITQPRQLCQEKNS
jgi:hypothetical protein